MGSRQRCCPASRTSGAGDKPLISTSMACPHAFSAVACMIDACCSSLIFTPSVITVGPSILCRLPCPFQRLPQSHPHRGSQWRRRPASHTSGTGITRTAISGVERLILQAPVRVVVVGVNPPDINFCSFHDVGCASRSDGPSQD